MNQLLEFLTGLLGPAVPVGKLIKLVPVLAPIVADLADGDSQLTQENRLKIQEAVDQLQRGVL